MRVLILSVTTGYGHNACAGAIKEALEERNAETRILDTLEYINPLLGNTVDKGYLFLTKYSRVVYSRAYRIAEKRIARHHRPPMSLSRMTHSVLASKLVEYLREYEPDVVICTHVFAAQMMTQMQLKYDIKAKTIGVVTDFTIHPYWEDSKLDYYVVANQLLEGQFKKKGLSVEKLLPIGIPIYKKFSKKKSQAEARKELGIEDKATILLMAGSMGYGNILKVIPKLDTLDLDFQLLTVCGKNERLKKSLEEMQTNKKNKVYGFVDNIDLMMDAADCICSKPGGLTTSEALAKGLRIIMPDAIPGQEERNMEFLLNNGLGIRATKTFPIDECVYELFANKNRMKNLDAFEGIAKPFASSDLAELIVELCK